MHKSLFPPDGARLIQEKTKQFHTTLKFQIFYIVHCFHCRLVNFFVHSPDSQIVVHRYGTFKVCNVISRILQSMYTTFY